MIGLNGEARPYTDKIVKILKDEGEKYFVEEVDSAKTFSIEKEHFNAFARIDAIRNFLNRRNVLDHGFVELVDVMPRLYQGSMDRAILQAARVSTGSSGKTWQEDRGLIRYLMRHRHTTPFEMVEFKFHCKMPIFVARQWIRHRTANVNEKSARYGALPDDFYYPDPQNIRMQSSVNKQGGESPVSEEVANEFLTGLKAECNDAYSLYEAARRGQIANELARLSLPVNIYTEWYWKIDLHNLLHFLSLRCDSHAQWEIQQFGNAMLSLIAPHLPWTIEAWNDFHPYRDAVILTRNEIKVMHGGSDESMTGREKMEWEAKKKELGLR